jgi:type IV pilus assembly protein PilA
MARREDDGGFTLIELLVVIIIIGILAAIAIPTYLKQRETAYRTQAVHDMRKAATAIETYVANDPAARAYSDLDGADKNNAALVAEGLVSGVWTQLVVHQDGSGYCIDGTHDLLPGERLVYRNSQGVVQVGAPGAVACT